VVFAINDSINSETGFRPFELKYGSADGTYCRLPETLDSVELTSAWLRNLNTDLAHVRAASKKHQDTLALERTAANPPSTQQNRYQPGDFILYNYPKDQPKPTKLSSPHLGPYEVIKHEKNEVEARHICMGTVRTFHVDDVQIFIGDRAAAFRVSMTDADQHQIEKFCAYIGDPSKRQTCEFEVEFRDRSKLWLPWSKDLYDTIYYEAYCRERRELFPLLFTVTASKKQISAVRSQEITAVSPGDEVYVSLQALCPYYYDSLEHVLTDIYHTQYMIKLCYKDWKTPRSYKLIAGSIAVFNFEWSNFDNYFVTFYGSNKIRTPDMVILDAAYFDAHPEAKPKDEVLRRLPKKP
jgi:hypothetical protein